MLVEHLHASEAMSLKAGHFPVKPSMNHSLCLVCTCQQSTARSQNHMRMAVVISKSYAMGKSDVADERLWRATDTEDVAWLSSWVDVTC